MTAETRPAVVVIGAGIAGLRAAAVLVADGHDVAILEKSRGVGGRMATRRVGAAVCDHGAQFFTVRGAEFAAVVDAAAAAAVVTRWCDGFPQAGVAGGVAAGDGHPRYRGTRGMTDLPKHLAGLLAGGPGRCTIRTGVRAAAVSATERGVVVSLEDGANVLADGAVVTTPVPQALDLLAAGGMSKAGPWTAAWDELARVTYDPCFALAAVLDAPSLVPDPGGLQFPAGSTPLAWLADNQRKGISPVPAVTVHASGRFSRERFDAPPDAVADELVAAVRPWLPQERAVAVVERSLQRWKFALPTTLLDVPLVAVSDSPPIVCCGDAFAGPRVEGAAVSGAAAARWMLDRLAG